MKKTTFLMATVLAVTTVLAAGLTVLPSSVQEAQANPCANEVTESRGGGPVPGESPRTSGAQNSFNPQGDDDRECDFTGAFEFDEESGDIENGGDQQAPSPPESDIDADGVPDSEDNCVNDVNPDQTDSDGDGVGDDCDPEED